MKIHELNYSRTHTYLIEGEKGTLLFDTGWAGIFDLFRKELKRAGHQVNEIDYLMISHFHPDHMGIAGEIAQHGPTIVAFSTQRSFLHSADEIFAKEPRAPFVSIQEDAVRFLSFAESRSFLEKLGIAGEVLPTPGHTEDSISLCLDDGSFFVGDLNPLYELELHKGTEIAESWEKLLSKNPKTIYYGHAKTAVLMSAADSQSCGELIVNRDRYRLVERIMRFLDKGYSLEQIHKKTGAAPDDIEDIARMYLTHQNVGVQGILDRIEIKGK